MIPKDYEVTITRWIPKANWHETLTYRINAFGPTSAISKCFNATNHLRREFINGLDPDIIMQCSVIEFFEVDDEQT